MLPDSHPIYGELPHCDLHVDYRVLFSDNITDLVSGKTPELGHGLIHYD